MEFLRFVPVEEITEAAFRDYIDEWGEEELVPWSTKMNGMSFEEWADKITKARFKKYTPKQFVPSLTMFLISLDGTIIGAVNIRRWLNEDLLKSGGHIGYGIRPRYRRQGYGKTQLAFALQYCKALKIDRVLVTCDKENLASAATIMSCGGVLENEVSVGDEIIQRYWIDLRE